MGDPPFVLFLAQVVSFVALLALFGWLWGIVWAYRDARNRRAPAWAVALLVGIPVIWPLGLFLWYCFRPRLLTYT